ncbi:MAG TPA: hypothetical protein VHO25_15475 [Polyangiaceae bacterium]|nr:hypothetical protein [Polyangiaceae bacterium]
MDGRGMRGARRPGGPGMDGRTEPGRFGHNAPQMMQAARERMMKMSPEERAQFRERHKQAREQRRTAKVSNMRTRFGPMLKAPAMQEELRLNAERMAKLHRMQALAEDNGKNDLLDRVFALMKREQQRHMRVMSQLHGRQGPPGATGRTRPQREYTPNGTNPPAAQPPENP